jgi:HlyD family secretion protein
MIRRKYSLLVLLVVLALVGCQARSSATPATASQTAKVQRGNLTATISAAGTVAAQSQVVLTFQNSGQVKEINAKVGDKVKAGQVLAKLNAPDLELNMSKAQIALDTSKIRLQQTKAGPKPTDVASARASLASAQAAYQAALDKYTLNDAQLAVARAQVDKAKATLERAQLAYDWHAHDWLDIKPENSQQKKQLDDAQTAYDLAMASFNQTAAGINDSSLKSAAAQLAQAQYQLDNLLSTPTPQDIVQAEATVKQSEANLQQAQNQLAKAAVSAPFDGTVGDIYVQVGQWVNTSTQAVALVDLSRLDLAITLAEVDVPKVQTGQAVEIMLDAEQGKTFNGTVTEIDLVGTTTQGVVNYAATVSINDPTDTIRPGMNASANIILQQRENVLLVPNRAVRTVGNRSRTVIVLYGGQLIDVPVTLGLSGDTQSEVVDGLLHEGDVVLIGQTTTTARGVPGVGGLGGGAVFIAR